MIFLLFITAVAASDVLQSALQSGEAMARLYSQYENEQGRVYSLTENRLRFRLFRKSVQEAAEINSEELGWEAGLNMFSDMTPQEKGQYLGFNSSLPHSTGAPLPLSSAGPAADSIDWRDMGGVTKVKNQGRCGSCWTFGAVGSIEGVHFSKTKKLKVFAEQELLDCVYEGKRDGCQGGWMHDCFKYMQDNQRLAPSSAVKYRAKDGACNYSGKKNGLQVAVTGMYEVPKTEDGHVAGLTQGPIAVAFEVTSKCQSYRKGIFKDTSCTGHPNHAVTLVGFWDFKSLVSYYYHALVWEDYLLSHKILPSPNRAYLSCDMLSGSGRTIKN
eukprot:sb/3466701/